MNANDASQMEELEKLRRENKNLKRSVEAYKSRLKQLKRKIESLTIPRPKDLHKQANDNDKLMRAIAENLPNSYLSIIEKDLTVGFTAGQEFKKQNLDPNRFVGLTLAQVFGEHAPIVEKNYKATFNGEERTFELFINNQHQIYKTVPLYDEDEEVQKILP